MSKNIRTQLGKIVGKTLNDYHQRVKPKIDDLKFKEQYQGRIIDCMVGEVDDNYIETPETDTPVVKLEHSKEGLVKVPSIKGKTILVDADGNETDTPGEGCRLVSVGEDRDKIIILSKNKNLFDGELKRGYALGIEEGFHFGDFYPSENYSSSINYIIVEPNVTYRVNKDRIWVIEYDKHFNPIKFNSGWTTFVFDLNTKYIRFYLNNANTLNVQIEKNENITSYVPHQSHKTEILLKEPLREGDYIEGKKIYRNVKQDGLTLIPLEEPIIEELPNSITLQGFDNTTMYIENSITPTVKYGYNALIPYKQELLNQKEEVETNTLDIEQNIIPYLMDMEFNLMLMEDNE